MRCTLVLLAGAAHAFIGADAFGTGAVRALSRPSTSFASRPCLRMKEEETGTTLNFKDDTSDIDDAPVYTQEEADFEAKTGQEVKKVEEKAPDVIPEDELTDAELRDRARMLAIKKYAPWMADMASEEAIQQRLQAERSREKKKAEKLVGNRIDPAKQEVSGAGLKITVDAGEDFGNVKLVWLTGNEENNEGFVVARKGAGQAEFQQVASYESFQSLRSKGPAGGTYTFVDERVSPGEYLYKVQDVATGTKFMTDVCQRGCEVQTKTQQQGNLAVLAGFGAVLTVIAAAGVFLDPQ